jgi:predicted TIM-barrel fold metal-dependent hydrolase
MEFPMNSRNIIPLHHVWNYTDVDRVFWQEHLADWLPRKIFDAHTHVNDSRFQLQKPTEEMKKQFWVNELIEPISADTAHHCYSTVFPEKEFSCLAFGYPSFDFDIEASNESLQQDASKYGWYSLAVLRPQWSAEMVSELLGKDRVLGAKVYYSLISEDKATRDKHVEASIFGFLPHHQLEVLNAHKAWVTLHVPKASRLGHPDNICEIREIRERYPNIKLIIAHLGRCYTIEHAKEALPQLSDDRGLYFDNSAVMNPEVHRFALELLGPERILYGTDNPVFYMRGRRQWKEYTYTNRTNYPFHFNKERESAEIEATYTLYMYEALLAIKTAAQDLQLSREDVERLFSGNAYTLIKDCAK